MEGGKATCLLIAVEQSFGMEPVLVKGPWIGLGCSYDSP